MNGRGATDYRKGRMTPRALRSAVERGEYRIEKGLPPSPPVEWPAWKRTRFASSIAAANLFMRGKEIEEIGPRVGRGTVGKDVTKQRIAQMVAAGVKFLLDREYVAAVK